ncbi:MAG: NAD(P)H-dependent oxidoreductase subunit E [Synergistaceae bacterium]|nr:NAD(P)H-dependent oxidoreductase subunit E [Synergistaceae bacterium]
MKEHSAIERYISKMEDYELYEKVDNVMDLYGYKQENLIQILHAAQTIFGCVPLELQRFIADALDMTLSEVSGVVSFYSFFSVTPRGEHTIRVCMGTACYVRGGKRIVDHLLKTLNVDLGDTTEDGRFTLEIARCIGSCGLAPALMIDDVIYKQMTPNKVDAVLSRL